MKKNLLPAIAPVLLAAAICAGASGCGSGSGPATSPPPSISANAIAFASSRALDGSDTANINSISNIWVMNADGSPQTPLTKLTAAKLQCCLDLELVWSPDGSKIAFTSLRALDGSDAANINSISNIWMMNADGSAQTPLTKLTAPNVYSVGPVWSTDGSKIVFTSARALDGSDAANINSISNIWVMNADGSAQTPLTKLTASNAGSSKAVWSPNGGKIAFTSRRALDGSDAANTNSISNIWVMNADGSAQTPLTKFITTYADSFGPAWSPDGSKIAFTSFTLPGYDPYPGYRTNIWVMSADGSAQNPLTKLTAAHADSSEPVWSPDGSKIAFTSARALDGSDSANNLSDNAPTSNIWVMNADGSTQTPLTKLTQIGAHSWGGVWSRDGSKVAFTSARALDGSNAANINSISNIWVMNADGSAQTPLTRLTASNAESRRAVWRH